jgi:hypothetical protein
MWTLHYRKNWKRNEINYCVITGKKKKNMLPIVRLFKDLHIVANIKQAKASLKGLSGIYCFRHIASGKIYLGQAVNLSARIMEHIKGRDSNIILQRAIN